jgi:predicted nucleic acid-binding protein
VFLLDTNVVSELRRARPHGGVLAWIERQPDAALHLSAYTIGELQAGVEAMRARDPERAAWLHAWIDAVPQQFHVLAVDAAAFRIWAKLMHTRSAALQGDAIIAATAERHGLTVATRNVRDFEALGVRVVNPFAARD